MASRDRRAVWVDHWTVHQDGDELLEDSTHANPKKDMENSSVPRYRGFTPAPGDLSAMNETALSLAGGEGSNNAQAGQDQYFTTAARGNDTHGLGYTDTSGNGQHAKETPVARKAIGGQLAKSRWAPATMMKGSGIWRGPVKEFVKANDQSLTNESPTNMLGHHKGDVYVPPHLRPKPAQGKQKAPEPQQQRRVEPARSTQHVVKNEPRDESPMTSALVHVSGPTQQNDEVATLNSRLEASLAIFGTGPPEADPDRDPRGVTPIQTWTEQDWGMTRRPKKKKSFDSESIARDSEVSGATSAPNWTPATRLTEWIVTWVKKTPDEAEAAVFQNRPKVYEECDVDCETGDLLAPVEYPRTMINPSDNDMYKKRRHTTSETLIAQDRKKKEQAEFIRVQKERIEKARLTPPEITEKTEPAMTRANPYECRAQCHIRPAELGDMVAVAGIYKQEVENGWRALDQDVVQPPSWGHILGNCQEQNLPFVVALSGYRDPRMPIGKAGHRVIGFAFLEVASRGITGSVTTNAKCSGRVYVMVDPQHRRARIGTALLDAVLRAVSPQYSPKENSYQWENPQDNSTYHECRYDSHSAQRQWRSILMEVYVQNHGTKEKTTKGEEYQAIWNWLEMDLGMNLISHSPMFGRADCLPTSPLLDRLVFEHRCCPAEILV
ncbi:Acyl-CoA N-acyltransferase [Apiospora aurea]|uniref:Acyl-CoA N-acyltransferase n=1 Tax=Apiospora aurea TaxID=335848 RepID=A0ABR1QBB8_9PEZI